MKKRSSYRPRGVNPQSYLLAIKGATKLSQADRVAFIAPIQSAVDTIIAGKAEKPTWATLFNAINTTEQLLAAGLARNWREWHESVQECVVAILDRQRASTSRALHAAEIDRLRGLVDTWADLLEVISCREFFQAREAAERKVQAVLRKPVSGVRVIEAKEIAC